MAKKTITKMSELFSAPVPISWSVILKITFDNIDETEISSMMDEVVEKNDSWEASYYSSRLAGYIGVEEVEVLNELLNNNKNPTKIRFFTFRVLFTRHRYQENISIMREMIDLYADVFVKEPLFEFYQALLLKYDRDPSNLALGIKLLDEFAEKYDKKGNPAFLQAYSDGIVLALREDMSDTGFQKEIHLPKAIVRITQAISRKGNYSKYYFTRAMLHLERGDYEKSRNDTLKALDVQKTFSLADVQRTTAYRQFLLQIENQKAVHRLEELEEQSSNIRRDLRNERFRSVEFIGVFSVLIALVISTTTLLGASGLDFFQSVMILTILSGILLILIEAMMVRLAEKGNLMEPLLFVVVGLILIVIGIFVGLNYSTP